jgi:gas vesicle protein
MKEVAVAESSKGGFLIGVLVGVAAGMLLAPRRGASTAAEGEELPGGEWQESAPPAGADSRAEALNRKIEETRRRLREQIGL